MPPQWQTTSGPRCDLTTHELASHEKTRWRPAAGGHPKEEVAGHHEGTRCLTSPSRHAHLLRYRTVGVIRRCLRSNRTGREWTQTMEKGLMIIAQQLP